MSKIRFEHHGDRSVGMWGKEATLVLELPAMSRKEKALFCQGFAQYLSETVFDDFYVDYYLDDDLSGSTLYLIEEGE